MDNEDDDDGNFTKWMSSYWGHGSGEDQAKERKRSFRRSRSSAVNRRASLPCMSQLENVQLKQLHMATTPPALASLKSRQEKEAQAPPPPPPPTRRVSSDNNGWPKDVGPWGESRTFTGLSESFEMLHLHRDRIMSLNDANNMCLICHEKLRNRRTPGGAQNLHYSHRLHKEVKRPGQETRPRSVSSTAVCERRKEVPFCTGQEEHRLPWHQLSLRRQR